ncbi:hypothetical protein JHK84_027692 [Glycine max]|nr:hypothetical protein JHK85_028093 [Glycine max]KAG5151220.1 hypothetical protein JHK84_027692 [Glycine max]
MGHKTLFSKPPDMESPRAMVCCFESSHMPEDHEPMLHAFRKVSIEDFGIDPLIWLCSPMRRKSDVAHSGRIERKGKQKHQLFDKCFFCYDSDN